VHVIVTEPFPRLSRGAVVQLDRPSAASDAIGEVLAGAHVIGRELIGADHHTHLPYPGQPVAADRRPDEPGGKLVAQQR
jgi:hypothetical protein